MKRHVKKSHLDFMQKLVILALGLTLFSSPALAAEKKKIRSDVIKSWEQVKTPEKYILSNDLYYNRMCSSIWTKQVPEFRKKNPHVFDPDVIPVGEDITVQRCMELDPEVRVTDDGKQKDKKQDDFSPVFNPYVGLYLGFITEKKEDDIATNFGFSVWGDVFKHLGYNIRLNVSESLITMQNEARLKTAPAPTRWHLIYGLGNRLGLKNKDLDRLTKGVDSFSYVGLGLELNPRDNYKLQFDLTTNLAERHSINAAASAMKRFGSDYWLGAYAEIQSTRSAVDSNEKDRRYITGGIKFMF